MDADAAAALDAAALAAGVHLAPAKINLALHVTGRRADGYHALSSLVAFAAIGDRLVVEPAAGDGFVVSGPFAAALAASLPAGASNSVAEALRQVRAVAQRRGRTIAPCRITLEKHLPVASGIGGGSADAAAVVRLASAACPELAAEFRAAAAAIGADVPMCVDSRAARVAGIGEIVEPVGGFPTLAAVLVNPGVPVSTPAVFRALERRDNEPMPAGPPRFTDAAALVDFLRATRNDLEEPATRLAPAIRDARDAQLRAGAAFARMSGSGATVFGLFADEDAAARAAAAIRAAEPGWWAVATVLGSISEGERA